jgi:hypothetical protein
MAETSPAHRARRQGEQLASELHGFIQRELSDPDARVEALLAVFDYFDRHTHALRDGAHVWPEAPRRRR